MEQQRKSVREEQSIGNDREECQYNRISYIWSPCQNRLKYRVTLANYKLRQKLRSRYVKYS